MAREVPLRHSLLVRLLAGSLLVAMGSIAASAWLASRTTTRAMQQEQGRVLARDMQIYDVLVDFAAGHPGWSGVDGLVRELSREKGRRIILSTADRHVIADSADPPGVATSPESTRPGPQSPYTAIVDPLRLADQRADESDEDLIDRRVLGPYALTRSNQLHFRQILDAADACMGGAEQALPVTYLPNSRPTVNVALFAGPGSNPERAERVRRCYAGLVPTHGEAAALAELNRSITRCLAQQGLDPPLVGPDFEPLNGSARTPPVTECIAAGRRAQLAGFVAPSALLFTSEPDAPADSGFDVSRDTILRILWVTLTVLTLTTAVTLAAGRRLTAPLRALTAEISGGADHPASPQSLRSDEIGHLTQAFRDQSQRRRDAEDQRRAMVNGIAHELRTPLNNIRGWLEAAEDGVAELDQNLVSSLLEETLLLQHVVDDLRDLAAADAGELRLDRRTVPVSALLGQVTAMHRAAAETAGVHLEVHVEQDLPAHLDPVRMRQAVGNLVSNAVRHSPSGTSVTVQAVRREKRLLIHVTDCGTGIEPQDLPKIFDRFWRTEKSRNRNTGGSGLGLAIARQYVQAHNGDIRVASTPGVQTVFTIDLPEAPVP